MRLIDADDLHVDYLVPSTTTMTKCYEYVSKAQINNAHTIEAVPVVHGRWMSVPHKLARVCSCCLGDEPYKFADVEADVYDFCPRCGAKMKGAES